MKKIVLALTMMLCLAAMSVTAIAEKAEKEKPDYSFLEDMSVKELKQLRAEIDKLIGDDTEDAEPVSEVIELTTENLSEYLEMGLKYGERDTHSAIGISITYVDVFFDVYPVVPAQFNDVKITARISCPNGWSAKSSDSAYDEDDPENMIIEFRLPADGKYSETHSIGKSNWAAPPEKDCTLEIVSVEGTVE